MSEQTPGEAIDQRLGAMERRIQCLEEIERARPLRVAFGSHIGTPYDITSEVIERWKRIEKAAHELLDQQEAGRVEGLAHGGFKAITALRESVGRSTDFLKAARS